MIKSVIFGCHGLVLNPEEEAFFKRVQPLGFILFARNIDSKAQVQALIRSLQQCVKHKKVPILVDQEGGRVARLNSKFWRLPPPSSVFGKVAEDISLDQARSLVYKNYYLIGTDLLSVGINVNCAPTLDLLIKGADDIIGDRSFGPNPLMCSILGLEAIRGLQDAGVIPVIKHMPGHGRADVDSHHKLPVVDLKREILFDTDFFVFKNVMEKHSMTNKPKPWGMTAHICYPNMDEMEVATFSSSVIHSVIRKYIGFDGFLVSDCLTMKALLGDFESRAKKALQAGCDAVLHCSGDLDEMIQVASGVSTLSQPSIERLNRSWMIADRQDEGDICKSYQETLERELKSYW